MVIQQWLYNNPMVKLIKEQAIAWFENMGRTKEVIKVGKLVKNMTSQQLKKNE